MSEAQARGYLVPMLAIVLGQAIMSFNVAALPVVLGGMVASFNAPPTMVATAIVAYSMAVAGFVMLGAKLLQKYGTVSVFRLAIVVFGASQVLMTLAPHSKMVIAAQLLCGLSAAVIVPSLVALIAENFQGKRQEAALGALGSAGAGAAMLAFVVGGVLATFVGWRPVFGILVAASAIVFLLSFRLRRSERHADVRIDWLGVLLVAGAVILVSFGFNNLGYWGVGLARPAAPFTLLGLSPAPLLILAGVMLAQAFFTWTRRREREGRTPLLALAVLDAPAERAAVYGMFTIIALEGAVYFVVPLYIQIVQGRTPLATSLAMLPFNVALCIAALVVIRFYRRFTPRQIGRFGFLMCATGLLWLAVVMRNDWSTVPVVLSLVVFGIGQGALVTLLVNVLVSASPKELAGDVGSLRGTVNNLGAAVGTALAAALMVGLLSAAVMRNLATNPVIPQALQAEMNLDSITFVSNEQLASVLERTTATPEQKAEALAINTSLRLQALKIGLLVLAGLAMLAIIPAGRLPDFKPGDIPKP